jgi:5-methylcytosine-specific restriction endonuclease McrA
MTARAVKEWVGKRPETAAPASVKARIVLSQGGICGCGCGVKLGASGEPIEFDHIQALILGGENREGNLRALRRPCHKNKTRRDVAMKATEARKRNKHLGLAKETRNPIPGSKRSRFKRRIDGTVVDRETGKPI